MSDTGTGIGDTKRGIRNYSSSLSLSNQSCKEKGYDSFAEKKDTGNATFDLQLRYQGKNKIGVNTGIVPLIMAPSTFNNGTKGKSKIGVNTSARNEKENSHLLMEKQFVYHRCLLVLLIVLERYFGSSGF